MKVTINSTQTHQSQPLINTIKPNLSSTNLSNYEPKSVLELRRSPSPSIKKPIPNPEIPPFFFSSGDNQIHLEEQILNNFEDWDSLIRDLGLQEEEEEEDSPEFSLPDFRRMNDENELDFVDELIRSADCFESGECHVAHSILSRLDRQLATPLGKPLRRASFYFKEALQSLLLTGTYTSGSYNTYTNRSSCIIETIKAYKNFSTVSPITMFSSFTASQAILEAVDGAPFVHVIDFDIGFGGQWAPFMREISDRAHSRKTNPTVFRITAIVPEDYAVESRLVGENLNQFAREVKLAFEIEFVSVQTFEYLSFKAVKFMEGEKIAVLLSPTIFRTVGVGILNDMRQLSPDVAVMVDADGTTGGGSGTGSFRRSLIDGLEFYSTIMESLEAVNVNTGAAGVGAGAGDEWIRRIEMYLLRPKIQAVVEAAGRRAVPWREAFAVAGMRPVALSQFADFQAECLLRKVQVRGFHVAKQQAELVLCWHERAMVATSAWRC